MDRGGEGTGTSSQEPMGEGRMGARGVGGAGPLKVPECPKYRESVLVHWLGVGFVGFAGAWRLDTCV